MEVNEMKQLIPKSYNGSFPKKIKRHLPQLCLLCLLTPLTAWAQTCIATEWVNTLAYREGQKIVKHYDGGRNIRVYVRSCDYDPDNDQYTIDMATYWEGAITDKTYNIDGLLKVNRDGSGGSYKETYSNENIKNWVGLKTGFSILDAIIKNSSNYSR